MLDIRIYRFGPRQGIYSHRMDILVFIWQPKEKTCFKTSYQINIANLFLCSIE